MKSTDNLIRCLDQAYLLHEQTGSASEEQKEVDSEHKYTVVRAA